MTKIAYLLVLSGVLVLELLVLLLLKRGNIVLRCTRELSWSSLLLIYEALVKSRSSFLLILLLLLSLEHFECLLLAKQSLLSCHHLLCLELSLCLQIHSVLQLVDVSLCAQLLGVHSHLCILLPLLEQQSHLELSLYLTLLGSLLLHELVVDLLLYLHFRQTITFCMLSLQSL